MIIEGKMMGMVIITFLQQLMLVLLGQLAFGVGYFNSPAALLMTMISLSVLAACRRPAHLGGLPLRAAGDRDHGHLRPVAGGARGSLVPAGGDQRLRSPGWRTSSPAPGSWTPSTASSSRAGESATCSFPLGIVWIWIVVLFALAVWRFRPE